MKVRWKHKCTRVQCAAVLCNSFFRAYVIWLGSLPHVATKQLQSLCTDKKKKIIHTKECRSCTSWGEVHCKQWCCDVWTFYIKPPGNETILSAFFYTDENTKRDKQNKLLIITHLKWLWHFTNPEVSRGKTQSGLWYETNRWEHWGNQALLGLFPCPSTNGKKSRTLSLTTSRCSGLQEADNRLHQNLNRQFKAALPFLFRPCTQKMVGA